MIDLFTVLFILLIVLVIVLIIYFSRKSAYYKSLLYNKSNYPNNYYRSPDGRTILGPPHK